MKKLRPLDRAFWNGYLAQLPLKSRPKRAFVEANFAGRSDCTDSLIRLYRQGKKTAGSSLVRDFTSSGDPLPKVGDYWIILDSHKRPQILVRTIRIEINRFKSIPKAVVVAEGEGDLSISHWKRVHRNAYMPFLKKWGIADVNETEVITEHFEILHDQATGKSRPNGRRPVPRGDEPANKAPVPLPASARKTNLIAAAASPGVRAPYD